LELLEAAGQRLLAREVEEAEREREPRQDTQEGSQRDTDPEVNLQDSRLELTETESDFDGDEASCDEEGPDSGKS
jgi:hypothetical protein